MQTKLIIDDDFISKWCPKYDKIQKDDEKYKKILTNVKKEIDKNNNLSKDTFQKIIDWKAARARGKINWNNFKSYQDSITDCLNAPDDKKISILDNLEGMGVAFASTILHFIYPDSFPIIDFRTTEVLYYGGYIKSKIKDPKRYIAFRNVILGIAKDYPRWSLREIDKALFAYHKIELAPKIKYSKEK